MPFWRRLRKKSKADKPSEAAAPERKSPAEMRQRVSEGELERAKEMASKLALDKTFSEFCRQNRLGDPEQAFMKFYEVVAANPAVWKLEAKTEDAAADAGKKFRRRIFYGELFMRCKGDSSRITSLLFKANR